MNRQIRPEAPFKLISIVGMIAFTLISGNKIASLPMYNLQDPAIIHTIYGTDKFYQHREKSGASIHISPFYQHTISASNQCGRKVPAGNIYGPWNMFALFYNDPRTASQRAKTPIFEQARTAMAGLKNADPSLLYSGRDYTVEKLHDPDRDDVGQYKEVKLDYEKMGLRLQLNYDFAFGLGFAARFGVADYSQKPEFIFQDNFLASAGATTAEGVQEDASAKVIFEKLMSDNTRNCIAKELCLNLCEQCDTDFEDIHISAYWHWPIGITHKDCDCQLTPYFSIGVWLPTGRETNTNEAFSIAFGNDGFTGVTVEASLGFEFPDILQMNAGVGVLFSSSRDLSCQRVPTSEFQTGFIPFETNITKDPGPIWYANLSFRAIEFIKHFSFNFDYIYTRHTKDDITLANKDCATVFKPEVLEKRSKWMAQVANAGLQYHLSEHCSFGFAVQGYIAGKYNYRTTTLLGSIMLEF